jgi:hypothetical protein
MDETKGFLRKHLGVRAFNSALLVLRQTEWGKRKPTGTLLRQSDPRFWYARGVVRKLLDGLWQHSLAPFKHDETINDDYRRTGYKEQQIYLFIKDEHSLLSLAKPFKNDQTFFSYLETLDLSDLVRDVRIWVDREGAEGEIPFHEVSDGEKQLLSVLGMMRFAAHDHSLFLLDEPDTHLNPAWKWNYPLPGQGSRREKPKLPHYHGKPRPAYDSGPGKVSGSGSVQGRRQRAG